MERRAYPCDISDREWDIIEPLLPSEKLRGKKREVELREIVNAIFYLLEEGCQWRALPHDFPHWSRSGERRRCWKQRHVLENVQTFSLGRTEFVAVGNRLEPTLTNGIKTEFGIV